MLLEEHRHAAGDDPAVLLVDHAGDVRRKNLFGRPAQHLFAWQTVIVLAGAVNQNVAGLLRAKTAIGIKMVYRPVTTGMPAIFV